jgi:hypothetical protein
MSPFQLDIDLLPFNVLIYKKDKHDFTLVACNSVAEKNEPIARNKRLGHKITDHIPNGKESELFSTMLRVEQSGATEVINMLTGQSDTSKQWHQYKITKLTDNTLAIFSNRYNIDGSLEYDGDQHIQQKLNETERLLEHQK